jgi:hypothetical protein
MSSKLAINSTYLINTDMESFAEAYDHNSKYYSPIPKYGKPARTKFQVGDVVLSAGGALLGVVVGYRRYQRGNSGAARSKYWVYNGHNVSWHDGDTLMNKKHSGDRSYLISRFPGWEEYVRPDDYVPIDPPIDTVGEQKLMSTLEQFDFTILPDPTPINDDIKERIEITYRSKAPTDVEGEVIAYYNRFNAYKSASHVDDLFMGRVNKIVDIFKGRIPVLRIQFGVREPSKRLTIHKMQMYMTILTHERRNRVIFTGTQTPEGLSRLIKKDKGYNGALQTKGYIDDEFDELLGL